MSDEYKVGVSLLLSSNATQIFGALGQHFLKLDRHLMRFQENWKKTALLVGGGLGVFGGVEAIKGAVKLIDKGNDLVKIQRDMREAGASSIQVQNAYAKAWEMTAKYQNMSAVEVLKMQNDARMTFGNQDLATQHIEDFVQMASFLKAYQGGKHAAHSEGLQREVNAAMKSGEIAGKINPEDMAEHVRQLTAMKVAYGDQVKITQYLTAQRTAGVALRNSSDAFRYGMFPALVQENGSRAGTMLMTAYNKIVAGVMNRTISLQHMDDIGLLHKDQIKYDKVGRAIGLNDPSAIINNRDAAINFGDWVMKTLKPMLDAKTTDPIEQSQLISSLFPDRMAAMAVTEIVQQYTKLQKDAEQMAKARAAMNPQGYTEGSWDAQKQAFSTQFESFLSAVGAPMVATATEHLKSLNQTMAGFSQWAGKPENADTIRDIMKSLMGLGAFFVAGGTAAIIAALGPLGILVGGLGALAVVLASDGFSQDHIDTWLAGLRGLPGELDRLFGELNYKLSFGLFGTKPKDLPPEEDGKRQLIDPTFEDRWPGLPRKQKLAMQPDKLPGVKLVPPSLYPTPDDLPEQQKRALLNATPMRQQRQINLQSGKDLLPQNFSPEKTPGSQPFGEKKTSLLPDKFNPGQKSMVAQPIALSLTLDGRTLAQVISEQLEYLYEHATGAPSYNARSHFARADGGMAGV